MVRLVDQGPGKDPKLLVNSKQVGWDDLRDILKPELSSRPDWTVYVGADECIPWVTLRLWWVERGGYTPRLSYSRTRSKNHANGPRQSP
jgi:hypothetical protein